MGTGTADEIQTRLSRGVRLNTTVTVMEQTTVEEHSVYQVQLDWASVHSLFAHIWVVKDKGTLYEHS